MTHTADTYELLDFATLHHYFRLGHFPPIVFGGNRPETASRIRSYIFLHTPTEDERTMAALTGPQSAYGEHERAKVLAHTTAINCLRNDYYEYSGD